MSTPLSIQCDDALREISEVDFADESRREELRGLAESGTFEVDVSGLPSWSLGTARQAVVFLNELASLPSVRFGVRGQMAENLFEALRHCIDRQLPTQESSNAIQLGIEGAAVCMPDVLCDACSALMKSIRNARIQGRTFKQLFADAKSRARANRLPDRASESPQLDELFPDLQLTPGLNCPGGWQINEDGVTRQSSEESLPVCSTPVVIRRRFVNAATRQERVELAWRRDGQTIQRIVDRIEIASAREIVSLAAFGLPVTSSTAAGLVEYLAAYESSNETVLRPTNITDHMGWQGEGLTSFLWGGTELAIPAPDVGSVPQNHAVVFHGKSDGDEQLADGFRTRGSLEGWIHAVGTLQAYPKVQLAIYAALAPVLLEIVRSTNFILSYAGPTSGGKTTTLRLATSVWGCADEREPAGALFAWDSSRVFRERILGILASLPLIIDDTKRARSAEEVAQMVYDAASGRGRGRGDPKGIQRSVSWRTIMITSGEAPLASFSKDTGTPARILESWGSPFGETSEFTATVVRELNRGVLENYGHAGPTFVRYLLDNRNRWPEFQQQYAQFRNRFQQRAGSNNVAGRMAEYLAVLELAQVLAHEALPLPWTNPNVVERLWSELTAESREADRAGVALDFVSSWAHANQALFAPMTGALSANNRSSHPYAGRWRVDVVNPPESLLAFFPHKINELLRNEGFNPDEIRRTWRDRNWIRCSGNKLTYKARMPNSESRTAEESVAIRWSVLEQRLAEGADPEIAGQRRAPGLLPHMPPTGNGQGTT